MLARANVEDFPPPHLVQSSHQGSTPKVQNLPHDLILLPPIFLGHIDVVKFLIEACKVNPFVKDR